MTYGVWYLPIKKSKPVEVVMCLSKPVLPCVLVIWEAEMCLVELCILKYYDFIRETHAIVCTYT
jgi:hypothetical protein